MGELMSRGMDRAARALLSPTGCCMAFSPKASGSPAIKKPLRRGAAASDQRAA